MDKTSQIVATSGTVRAAPVDPASLQRPGQYETNPPTKDPLPSELSFTPADDARDVTGRLRAYAAGAGVEVPGVTAAATQLLTLQDAFRISQQSGRELLTAQETYLLSAISLLIERHLWGPRFFNDTTALIRGEGDDGRYEHALDVVNTLRATQRLPYGGNVEAAWVWDATEQLRRQATDRYTQSSRLVVSGTIPLLRGAGMVAREDLIQAERDLVYAARDFERFRREYLVEIAVDYFQLLETKASIANQRSQLESLRLNEQRTKARVDAGKLEAFEVGIATNQVLSAESSLVGLLERYLLELERFKIRLGMPLETLIDVKDDDLGLPDPDVTQDQAAQMALDLRLDLQNERDRLDDQRRRVAVAKDQLLPDLSLGASATLPTDGDSQVGGLNLSPDDARYSASVTLSLPLDREQERLRLRASLIALQRAQREFEQSRDEIVVNVRSSVRDVELARFRLRLAEEAIKINQQRKRGQELREDTVTTQEKLDTEVALLEAQNQRDSARTDLRTAVLQYLLDSGQLRVDRVGRIEPLPGMNLSTPPESGTPAP